jgi:LPXTG-motif cell wall-anchored protein
MFSGLDEGIYYLKETAAPDGYTLNDNDYKIEIAATLGDGATSGEEGALTGYTVNVYVWDATANDWTACGDAVYTIDPTVTKPTTDANAMSLDVIANNFTGSVTHPAEVVDTPLATLPSTGGAGTIALTLVSATGMGAFFTLYMINRKKKKDSKD